MRKVRPGILGNFVPLDRVLEAVASRVQLSNEELDSRRSLNDPVSSDEVEASLQRWPIRQILSKSRAASALLPLLNRPQSQRPDWIELRPGGPQLRDESVAKEGVIILFEVEQQDRALIASRLPFLGKTSSPPPGWAEGVIPRISSIGFDRDELIAFLDKNHTPHNLGEPLNFESTAVEQQQELGGHAPPLVRAPLKSQQDRSPSPERRKFSFRGELSEVLHAAVQNAADPNRYQSVFEALRELACSESPQFPLLGYNDEDREVLWGTDPNSPKTFTMQDMRSRFRKPRKR